MKLVHDDGTLGSRTVTWDAGHLQAVTMERDMLRDQLAAAERERDRAIETRENANTVSLRVEVERDSLRDRIERALSALSQPNASNYERVQAAGLILTGESSLEKDSAMSASRRNEASP